MHTNRHHSQTFRNPRQRILIEIREKQLIMYKKDSKRSTADLVFKTMSQEQWISIIKYWKKCRKKCLSSKNSAHPATSYVKNNGESKTLSDK
jgi:L-asparaginase/Glu-tRNA(Gln) amidotransferase subunit D